MTILLPDISFSWGGFQAMQLGGVALFVSLAITGFMRIAGLGDIPNHRSSHVRMTPTSGGVGVIAGVGAAVLAASVFHDRTFFPGPEDGLRMANLLALLFAVGMLGLIDDRFDLPPKPKFAILIGLSVLVALCMGVVTKIPVGSDYLYLSWILGLIGTTLWVFVTINSVNFFDGIDGLMGLSMAVASGALCALSIRAGAPQAALLAGTLCAGLVGFLAYNAPPAARIFSGDCGALFIGALYAAAVLSLVREQPDQRLLYAGALLILPILTDVLMTLVSKPIRGIPLFAPHRLHIFHRLAALTGSHLVVTLLYGLISVGVARLVLQAYANGTVGSASGMVMMIGVFGSLYMIVSIILPETD